MVAEKEYIEREALRLAIFNTCWRSFADVDTAYDMADRIPAADVAPVRHGRWIKTIRENGCAEWTDFTCSVCGCVFDGNSWLFSEWKGCPVCLAKMELGGG